MPLPEEYKMKIEDFELVEVSHGTMEFLYKLRKPEESDNDAIERIVKEYLKDRERCLESIGG